MFYSPFSSGYSSFQDPSARGRTMRRAEPARTTWGQPAISPYNSYDSYLPGSRYVVDDAYPYSPSYDREDLRRRQMMMRQQEIDRKQALMDAQERAAEESMSHSLRSSPSLRQTSPHKVCPASLQTGQNLTILPVTKTIALSYKEARGSHHIHQFS